MTTARYTGKKYLGCSGVMLSRMIGATASAGFLLLGYDQGVMSGVLTLPSFNEVFPSINTEASAEAKSGASSESVLQGLTIGLYEIGCLIGALSCIWLGDLMGRRRVIWGGTIWMIVGAIIQTSSYSLPQLIVGRIIGGIGNGWHSATIPSWQSECSPPHKRGMLVMVEGLLITCGIATSYLINLGCYFIDPSSRYTNYNPQDFPHRSASWRFPIAFQIVLCIPTFLTIWMPESPRWLLLKGRTEEAQVVMGAIDELPPDDPGIVAKVKEVQNSLALAEAAQFSDVFIQGKEKYFHRMMLGVVSQMFQQLTGINIITYYATTLYQTNLGLSALLARILSAANGIEYAAASVVPIFLIDRIGRRPLMLFGSAGMCIVFAILGGLTSPAALQPLPSGEAANKAPAYAGAVFLFIFNTFFAIGWLGLTWLYPSEITPLKIRAAANGLSTASNWMFNFLVVMITPIMFSAINNYTYATFAVLNFVIGVASYFIFPETANRSLEEMSAVFEKASIWNPYDVVKIERRMPKRYDRQGRLRVTDEELQQGMYDGGVKRDIGELDEKDKVKSDSPTMFETRDANSERSL